MSDLLPDTLTTVHLGRITAPAGTRKPLKAAWRNAEARGVELDGVNTKWIHASRYDGVTLTGRPRAIAATLAELDTWARVYLIDAIEVTA